MVAQSGSAAGRRRKRTHNTCGGGSTQAAGWLLMYAEGNAVETCNRLARRRKTARNGYQRRKRSKWCHGVNQRKPANTGWQKLLFQQLA